jgi:hypothetical protein
VGGSGSQGEAAAPQTGHPRLGGHGDGARPLALGRPNDRRVLLALLGVAVALLLAGVIAWRVVPDAPSPPPLPPAGAAAESLTLESAEPAARAQAERWLPGARLLNASMQIDWPWQRTPLVGVPGGGWITFVYVAPWSAFGQADRAASLSLVLERQSGEVVRQATLGWETPPSLLATPEPAATPVAAPGGLSSAAAALVAEAAGGTAFRLACPELRYVSRVIPVGDPGNPTAWVVVYEDARESDRHGFIVRFDAATGELLETGGEAPPCPEG